MEQTTLPHLADLPADALTARLYEIAKQERNLLVEFLRYLGEVDRRALYLELGFPSLFAFLTDHLGYTSSAAFRRSTAARLLLRFPMIAAYLDDGRLCLTTLVELRDVLDETRAREILDRAAGRTEAQVKELVAALRPRPAPMDLLRRMPERPAEPVSPAATAGPAVAAPPPPPRPAPRVEPISEELRMLRMTVGREFVADLEAVRAALSHQIPDRNLEKVLHACIRLMLRDCERRRRGTGKPAKTGTQPKANTRYVPAALRDAVWRRDEGRCAFVGVDGHRCNSTHQLQVDHIHPLGKGGEPTVENLRLACAAHNLLLARKHYGADRIAAAISARQHKSPPKGARSSEARESLPLPLPEPG